MIRTALLIDGGLLRDVCKRNGNYLNCKFVEEFSSRCFETAEHVYRILYYDAPLFVGKVTTPVDNKTKEYPRKHNWLDDLATREKFAVRQGRLTFRGWKLRKEKFNKLEENELTDWHFKPNFEQKGVDMRIGMDIAVLASKKKVDRIIIVTNDTDIEPAMKYARIEGLETVIVKLKGGQIDTHKRLLRHSDMIREVDMTV